MINVYQKKNSRWEEYCSELDDHAGHGDHAKYNINANIRTAEHDALGKHDGIVRRCSSTIANDVDALADKQQ